MAPDQEERLREIVKAVVQMEVSRLPPDEGVIVGGRFYARDEVLAMIQRDDPLIQRLIVNPGITLLKKNKQLLEKVVMAYESGDGGGVSFLIRG